MATSQRSIARWEPGPGAVCPPARLPALFAEPVVTRPMQGVDSTRPRGIAISEIAVALC
jgi:hypothetical protein